MLVEIGMVKNVVVGNSATNVVNGRMVTACAMTNRLKLMLVVCFR